MESIASVLKSQRERRKLSLSQVAADTRISLRHLESIEEGRFEDLPGGMYNRAFLRAYCERLELDQSELLERYESEVLPRTEKPSRPKPAIGTGASWRIPPLAVWSLMLAVSATGIFLARKSIYQIFSPYFSRSAAPTVTYAPPPTAPEPTPAPAASPLPSLTGAPAGEAPEGTAAVTPPAEASATPPAGESGIRLEVEGKESCWISIERDGVPALEKILEPGEIQAVSATEKIRIVVGNAGGVLLRINGKRAKPLGRPGEVVRLLIDRDSLADLLAPGAG